MSTGERIFLAIAIAWLGLWGMGSWLFFSGAASHDEEAERAAMPVTALVPGGDVRIDGVVADVEESVVAPLSELPCAAARTDVYYRTSYEAQNKTHFALARVTTLLLPPTVEIRAGNERVELPLEYWRPPRSKYADLTKTFDALPDRFGVADEDIARARADNPGEFAGFVVEEWTLRGGEPLFVTGRLEARDGKLLLSPSPGMDEVVVYRGSQADVVEHLRGEASGLRIAGSAFVGISLLLLVPFGIMLVRRARFAAKRAAP